MNPLSVVHVNTERTWRGGEGQTLALARGLAARGHRSAVVAQPASPMAQRAREAGLPVDELSMRGEIDAIAVARMARILRRREADIVHMHTSHAHTLGVAASKLAGQARRVVSRRVDFSIHRHRFGLSGLKYRYGVDRYIAISVAVRNALIEDGLAPERISLVHSGVDPTRWLGGDGAAARCDLGVPAGAPLVGTLAHFGWHKSLETLVQAAAAVVEAHPDAYIAIVGEGNLRPQLEAERDASPARDRILLPGFKERVGDLLAGFDVFVMPSVMEGLCTSILDAFAVGVPVVCSRAGGMVELVEDERTGLLAEPGDPVSLANALVRMLGDGSLRQRVAEAASAKLHAGFTHDAMVDGTVDVYRTLLGSHDRSSEASA